MAHESIEVAARVRHEPDPEAVVSQGAESGKRVVVELEVLRVLPAARDLDGDRADVVAVAAHPAHDVLREPNPDLLVMVEFRMMLQVEDGVRARLGVATGIELETIARARSAIALGAEQWAGLGEGEVDVEEDGPQGPHTSKDSLAE